MRNLLLSRPIRVKLPSVPEFPEASATVPAEELSARRIRGRANQEMSTSKRRFTKTVRKRES